MINTRNTTLNQRPETLNTIGMDIATSVDLCAMPNPKMPISQSGHVVIGRELVSVEDSITRDLFSHEGEGMPTGADYMLTPVKDMFERALKIIRYTKTEASMETFAVSDWIETTNIFEGEW